MNKIKIPNSLKSLISLFDNNNVEFYFVGGFIRDTIIKKPFKDIDIVIINQKQNILNKLFGKKPYIINDRFNTVRYIIKNMNIDINFTNKHIEYDLKQRDFTINAIACNKYGELIDPCNGLKDINNKIIRAINKQSFINDPVRLIRSYRFKENLNFTFAKGMKTLIKEYAHLLKNVKKERINTELQHIFSNINKSHILKELYKTGILIELFPELKKTIDFYHKKFQSLKLINHLLNTAKAIDIVLHNIKNKKLIDYANNNIFVLYFAALFHDIEKPKLMKQKGKKLSFIGHDIKSANTAYSILKYDLRTSKKQAIAVKTIIKMHMRPHLLLNSENITNRGYFKLMRDAGEFLEGLIILSMADKYASEGIIDKKYIQLFIKIEKLKQEINKKKLKLISGNDIMDYFNITSGPLIGKMIEAGNEYAIENKISDKFLILKFLKKQFKSNLS